MVLFLFVTHDLTNGTIAACRIYGELTLIFLVILVTYDRAVASLRVQFKAPGRVALLLLWIQAPNIDLGILTARDETRVVIEPRNPFDWLLVHHELEVWGDGSSEEPVDPDVLIVLTSEQVTTVRENNLTALLDRQTLVPNQFVVLDIHHLELVAETNNEVEAAWVESQCMRFKV